MSDSEAPKDWGAHKRLSRDKRAHNRKWSAKFLDDYGIKYESKFNGSFLWIPPGIWFWPGTGLWKYPKGNITGRGVRSLVNFLQNAYPPGDTQTDA